MTDNSTTPLIQGQEVKGSTAVWALITAGLGAMTGNSLLDAWLHTEASGPILALYRSSPLCCLVNNGMEILYGVFWITDSEGTPTEGRLGSKTDGSRGSIAATMQLVVLLIGVLPQVIQLLGMRGIPYTQACAVCFFISASTSTVTSIFGGEGSRSKREQLDHWLGRFQSNRPRPAVVAVLLLAHVAIYGILWNAIAAKVQIPRDSVSYNLADSLMLLSITLAVGGFIIFLLGSISGTKSMLWDTTTATNLDSSVYLMPLCSVLALPNLLMQLNPRSGRNRPGQNFGFLSQDFRDSYLMSISQYSQRCALFAGAAACGCFVVAHLVVNCVEMCFKRFRSHESHHYGASSESLDFSQLQLPQNQFIHSHNTSHITTASFSGTAESSESKPLVETESEEAWRLMEESYSDFDPTVLFSVPYLARRALPGVLVMSKAVIASLWRTGQGMSIIEVDRREHRWRVRTSDMVVSAAGPSVDRSDITDEGHDDQAEFDTGPTANWPWSKQVLGGLYVMPTVFTLLLALLVYYAGATGPYDQREARTRSHHDSEPEVGTTLGLGISANSRICSDVSGTDQSAESRSTASTQCPAHSRRHMSNQNRSTEVTPDDRTAPFNHRSTPIKLIQLLFALLVSAFLLTIVAITILVCTAHSVWNPVPSIEWAGKKVARTDKSIFWLAFALFNLLTCVLYYLVAFDGTGTHDPRWTNALS